MKISKMMIVALGCTALAACSGGADDNADANMDANLTTDMNMATDMNMDMNAGADMNMINGADGMNATENAMVNDMTTNDADANLANGM